MKSIDISIGKNSGIDILIRKKAAIEVFVKHEAGGSSTDIYNGPYEVEPSQYPIILSTSGKAMAKDVVVGPIPSNYGRITWNGSVLGVE